MEIKINREIRNYTESMFFGLSMRQFFFSIVAVAVAIVLYFTLKPIDGKYQIIEQDSAKTKSSLRTLSLVGRFKEYLMEVKKAQELNKNEKNAFPRSAT